MEYSGEHDISLYHKQMLSTENFLWLELDCRNVSGSLGKQEVL